MMKTIGRTLAFLALIAIMICMTYAISGQLFRFGAMVISSFRATEHEEAVSYKVIADEAKEISNAMDNAAEKFGMSKEVAVKCDELKAELNKYEKSGNIVGIYHTSEKYVEIAKSFFKEKAQTNEKDLDRNFQQLFSRVAVHLKEVRLPAIYLDKTKGLCQSLALIFTILCVYLTVKKYLNTKIIDRRQFLKKMLVFEVLIAGVCCVLFPFFWMLCTAFKPSGQELVINDSNPFDIVPTEPTLNNFRRVLKVDEKALAVKSVDPIESKKHFGTYFMNSLLVSTTAAFLVTLFASMGAYVFSKKNLPFKGRIFNVLLMSMMIPGMMFMVPQFFMICKMGLFGTKWAMFLPHLASVFGIFMLKQFMDTIPDSLLEAAQIDGASEWQVFRIVIIPLSLPIILTLFLLTFLSNWSNFLWQLIVTDFENPLSVTLPVGLALFRGQYTSELGLIMSASCFSIVPIAILFLFAQRYFIEGMTAGAVKE